jgi:hypothetical protein
MPETLPSRMEELILSNVDELLGAVDFLISDMHLSDVVDDELVIYEMAETNTDGWYAEDLHVTGLTIASTLDDKKPVVMAEASLAVYGDQIPDRMYTPNKCDIEAVLKITRDGKTTFEITKAELDWSGFEA